MICAIMQPTFMPWAGYFHLMASVDTFVFLDDVQFDRRSWQSRNRIYDGGSVRWLTCPTIKASRETNINQIQIDYQQDWRQTHLKKLKLNYSKAPFFNEMINLVEGFYTQEFSTLAESNIQLIKTLARALNIETECVNSSELAVEGKRSERLVNLCKRLGAEEYLSPQGSRDYIVQDNAFALQGIAVKYQEYSPADYSQLHTSDSDFESHLSILDVIANIGLSQARTYVSQ